MNELKEIKCPECNTPLKLVFQPENEHESMNKGIVAFECPCCGEFISEYVIRKNYETDYVDGFPFFRDNSSTSVDEWLKFNERRAEIASETIDMFLELRNKGYHGFSLDIETKFRFLMLNQEDFDLEDFASQNDKKYTEELAYAICFAIKCIMFTSFPDFYVLVLGRMLRDSKSIQAIYNYAEAILAMDGNY